MYGGVICVGSIVAAFLWHASASLCGDSLANVAVVSYFYDLCKPKLIK